MSRHRRTPAITTVASVLQFADDTKTRLPDGRWVPARPLTGDFRWGRLKAAWLVFTGRADALLWDGQP